MSARSRDPLVTPGHTGPTTISGTPPSSGHFSTVTKRKQDALKQLAVWIRKPLGSQLDRSEGIVYIADCYVHDQGRNMMKIGWSKENVPARIDAIKNKCGLAVSHTFQTEAFFAAHRVERIVHEILKHTAHIRYECRCGSENREWFDIDFQWAVASVFIVKSWLEKNNPYNCPIDDASDASMDEGEDLQAEGYLQETWVDTLAKWEASLKESCPISIMEFFVLGHAIRSRSRRPTLGSSSSPGLPRHYSTGAIREQSKHHNRHNSVNSELKSLERPKVTQSHSLPIELLEGSPSKNATLRAMQRTVRLQNDHINAESDATQNAYEDHLHSPDNDNVVHARKTRQGSESSAPQPAAIDNTTQQGDDTHGTPVVKASKVQTFYSVARFQGGLANLQPTPSSPRTLRHTNRDSNSIMRDATRTAMPGAWPDSYDDSSTVEVLVNDQAKSAGESRVPVITVQKPAEAFKEGESLTDDIMFGYNQMLTLADLPSWIEEAIEGFDEANTDTADQQKMQAQSATTVADTGISTSSRRYSVTSDTTLDSSRDASSGRSTSPTSPVDRSHTNPKITRSVSTPSNQQTRLGSDMDTVADSEQDSSTHTVIDTPSRGALYSSVPKQRKNLWIPKGHVRSRSVV